MGRLHLPNVHVRELSPNGAPRSAEEIAVAIGERLREDGVSRVQVGGSSIRFGPVNWLHREWHPLAAVGSGELVVHTVPLAASLTVKPETEVYSVSSIALALALGLPLLVFLGPEHALASTFGAAGGAAGLRFAMSAIRMRSFFRRLLAEEMHGS